MFNIRHTYFILSLKGLAAHVFRRAFVVLMTIAMSFVSIATFADDPVLVTIGEKFSSDKTFTLRSNANYQMYIGNNDVLAVLKNSNTSVETGDAYRFAFVEDPNNAGNYYLYNVDAEAFLGHNTTGERNNADELGTGAVARPIYVYAPGNTADSYCVAFTNNVTWGQQSGGGKTYYIFQINSTFSLEDWSRVGDGNSINVNEAGAFSSAELAAAQQFLSGRYDAANFDDATVTPGKVYTILSESGSYLSANGSGITTNTSATSSNEQWVFLTDANDNSKVYLYNVGQKKFILLSGSSLSLGTGVSAGAVKVYTTKDSHGYTLAFGFGSDWATGPALSVNRNFTANPRKDNRFKVAEATGATFTDEDMKAARRRLKNLPTNYSAISYDYAGISLNTQKYIIYTNPNAGEATYRGGLIAQTAGLTTTYKANTTVSTTDVAQQFVFVSPTDDNKSAAYLYSVSQELFVKGSDVTQSPEPLSSGNDINQIFVYPTDDYDYNRAFNFNSAGTWSYGRNTGGGNTNLSVNAANGVFVGTYNQINDNGSRFALGEAGDFSTTDLAFAREILNGYPKSTWAEQSAKITPTTKVYTLRDENKQYLSANGSGLTTSETADANAQFVFFADPDDATKIYLYSVGQNKFVTSSKGLTNTRSSVAAINIFTTSDPHGYNLSFGFAENWTTASAVGSRNTSSQTFRYNVAEVKDATYNQTFAHNLLKDGALTLEDIGIEAGQAYSMYSARAALRVNDAETQLITRSNNNDTDGPSLTEPNNPHDQFVFFTDPTDKSKVYLYNVKAEKFVSKESNGLLTTGATDPIYIFSTRDVTYPYIFSFVKSPVLGQNSGTPPSGQSSNYVINGGRQNSININNWSVLDVGNKFVIHKVDGATVNTDFIANIYKNTYDPALANISAAGLTTDNVVYTLSSENGGMLAANSSGLTTSTTANANTQFVFYTDPKDATKVYLYSVGQGLFLTASKTWGIGSNASALYAFKTSDSDGFDLALAFNENWATAPLSASSSVADKSTRFKPSVVEASATTYSQAQATTAYNGYYERATLEELGLSRNKVYYITSDVINADNKHVIVTGSGNAINWFTRDNPNDFSSLNDAQKQSTYFSFVTDSDDPTKVYLYSVNAEGVVNSSGNLVKDDNLQQIYLYATNNPDFPVAFAFSDSWTADGVKNLDGSANNQSSRLISTDQTIGSKKRFRLVEVSVPDYTEQKARAALKGWMTTEFHYTGVHGRPLVHKPGTNADVKYQDVSEVHYYYYVDTKRSEYNNEEKTITFKLPLMSYEGDGSSGAYEPRGYYRWYDYRVDSIATNGNLVGCGSALSVKYDVNGHALGYFATHTGKPTHSLVGAYYKIPDEANSASWDGDVIACDVSRYVDYNTIIGANGNRVVDKDIFTHEPTLSIRYVFHVLSAERIADAMRDSLWNDETKIRNGHNRAYMDQGVLAFGAKDISASMNIRCDLQDMKQYYFHPVKSESVATKHVVYNDVAHKFSENDFEDEVVQAERIELRVYSEDKSHFRYVGSDVISPALASSLQVDIKIGDGSNVKQSPYSLKGGHWQDLNSTGDQNLDDNYIGFDKSCYLVGYFTNADGSKKCPFYCARLDITKNSPLEQANLPIERREEYMTTNYGATVANFQFDDENSGLTQTPPTSIQSADNVSHVPSPFSWRQYSFHYVDLKDFSNGLGYNTYQGDYSLLHGDFLLYKSYANIPHDRTYYKTSGSQNGYFLMTDASDEARVLASQDFSGHLCVGSKIYISAWVANQTGESKDEQPELRFNLIGVKKNDAGEDVYTKPLASICSGSFSNNIIGYSSGNTPSHDWFQVYGVFTLPVESGVNQFTDFRIAIDNYCKNTNGADYAIDDIQVFQRNAKLTVIQIPALCKNTDADQVDIKIKANLATMQSMTSANASTGDQVIYYRLVDTDGNPVVGTEGFYGTDKDGKPANEYGYAVVPANYDATQKLPTTYGNDETDLFETGIDGQPEVVLVNNGFKLERGKQYYVSLGIPAGEGESQTISWGSSQDICTGYSDNFQLIEQQIQIAGSSSQTTSVIVPCGQQVTNDYKISLQVTAPDKVNGGLTVLNDVHFYWFIGTNEEYNTTDTEKQNASGHSLATAVSNYIAVYGSKAFNNEDDAPASTTDEGGLKIEYTAADQKMIKDSLYDATNNPKGKLIANYSTALEGTMHTLPTGISSVIAIPVDRTVEQNDKTYALCEDYQVLTVRGLQNGPEITLGVPGVIYPASETYRSVRLGLPQIKEMGTTGKLRIPITSRKWKNTETTETLQFVDVSARTADGKYPSSANLTVLSTNDPSMEQNTLIATLVDLDADNKLTLDGVDDFLTLRFVDNAASLLHEGYWYEVAIGFVRDDVPEGDQDGNNCPGGTFLTFKIVPEYLTWTPNTVTTSNWNLDANWRRSTAQELYNPEYEDYRQNSDGFGSYEFSLYSSNGAAQSGSTSFTARNPLNAQSAILSSEAEPKSYVPMYFSKVTIPALTARSYPMLPYILRNSVGLILRMQNGKGEGATSTNIQYDMMAMGSDVNGTDSIYTATNFDGNVCQQILFKPDAQMRQQQFLRYQKAWVEIEAPINTWSTFTTLLKSTPAGDLYVPKFSARQTTPAFQEISFSDTNKKWKINTNITTGQAATATKPYQTATPADDGTLGLFGAVDDQGGTVKTTLYSRMRMPVYQKLWGQNSATQYPETGKDYKAYDEPQIMLINGQEDNELNDHEDNSTRNAWSHAFNAMADNGTSVLNQGLGTNLNGMGIAVRVGDKESTVSSASGTSVSTTKSGNATALLRLPKADAQYQFYKWQVNGSSGKEVESSRTAQQIDATTMANRYRLGVDYTTDENSLATITLTTPMVYPEAKTTQGDGTLVDNPNGLHYVLIGNPYTASILVNDFISANRDVMESVKRDDNDVYCLWVLEGNVLKEYQEGSRNNRIAAGEAFFVKVKEPGRNQVYFTTRMQTDPNLSENSLSREYSLAPSRVYTVEKPTDVDEIISSETEPLLCTSPQTGILRVQSGKDMDRIMVYRVDGALVVNHRVANARDDQFYVGSGIVIVRAIAKDGSVQSRKVTIR